MEAWTLELYHSGTKGMHWGTRHWQNPDGTFNEAGKERYFGKGSGENYQKLKKAASTVNNQVKKIDSQAKKLNNQVNKVQNQVNKVQNQVNKIKNARLTDEQKKKIAKIAVGTLATAAIVGGTVYMAKTGKLDGIISKGKSVTSKSIESIRLKSIDPHGVIKSDALKSTITNADSSARSLWEKTNGNLGKTYVDTKMIGSKNSTNNAYRKLIKDLNEHEIESINSGKRTLESLYKDRLDKGLYSAKPSTNSISNAIGKVKDGTLTIGRNISDGTRRVSSGVKNAAKATVSGVNTAKRTVKTGVTNAKKAAKATVKAGSSKAGKSILTYAGKKALSSAQLNRQQKQQQQQYIRQYKRQHPGTKLSDKQILQNGGY